MKALFHLLVGSFSGPKYGDNSGESSLISRKLEICFPALTSRKKKGKHNMQLNRAIQRGCAGWSFDNSPPSPPDAIVWQADTCDLDMLKSFVDPLMPNDVGLGIIANCSAYAQAFLLLALSIDIFPKYCLHIFFAYFYIEIQSTTYWYSRITDISCLQFLLTKLPFSGYFWWGNARILYARIFLPFSYLWMAFSLLKTLFPKFNSLICSSLHPKEEAKYSEPIVVECARKEGFWFSR